MAGTAERDAFSVADSLATLVTRKRDIRAVVEELRALTQFDPPPAAVALRALLPISAWLHAKKAGEEGKAVRTVHQFVSAAAVSGTLGAAVAEVVASQLLSTDLADDSLPRQLSALRTFAEVAMFVCGRCLRPSLPARHSATAIHRASDGRSSVVRLGDRGGGRQPEPPRGAVVTGRQERGKGARPQPVRCAARRLRAR
jgi:hypothetical protein